MGISNVVTKEYVRDNRVFADICNYCVYDGRQVINPEALAERDITELGMFTDDKGLESIERLRDVLKLAEIKQYGEMAYAIIGVENRTNVDYTMVVRSMVNDALNYDAQLKQLAKQHRLDNDLQGDEYISGIAAADRLIPVVTIVVFWNADEWKGARCLHDMFEVENKELLGFVNNYKLNLLVPKEIEDFGKFTTDLGAVMRFAKYSKDRSVIKSFSKKDEDVSIAVSDKGMDVLNVCFKAGLKKNNKAEGGMTDMCIAIDELREEERELGRTEGRTEGEAYKLVQLIENIIRKKKLELDVACDILDVDVEEYRAAKGITMVICHSNFWFGEDGTGI